jgi:hypothetical protein
VADVVADVAIVGLFIASAIGLLFFLAYTDADVRDRRREAWAGAGALALLIVFVLGVTLGRGLRIPDGVVLAVLAVLLALVVGLGVRLCRSA